MLYEVITVDRVTAEGHGNVVTTMLALDPDLAGDPPDGGMEEKKCLDCSLRQVDDEVMTPDMSKLMREDRVITSYSIHYTKLYDTSTARPVLKPSAEKPTRATGNSFGNSKS